VRLFAVRLVAGLALGSAVLAACGGTSHSSVSVTVTAPVAPLAASTTAKSLPTVEAANLPGLGLVLVDSRGLTLYHNTRETAGRIVCTGGCAAVWPPLVVDPAAGPPTAGPGVTGTVGTITRPDSGTQVTYNGMPLYHFAGDQAPGDAKGQGRAGIWFAVPVAGATTTTTPSAASSGASHPAPAVATTRPSSPATTSPRGASATTSPPTTSAPQTTPTTKKPSTPPTTAPCPYPPCP